MTPSTTDRIERTIIIHAPRARVWRALTDPKEFGAWFGVKLEGPFAPGARLSGAVTSKGYEHLTLDVIVADVEKERLLSWRWHPHACEKGVDYSHEPRTLVEFTLADVPEGTRLTVVESGFDQVPIARRALAFKMNGDGWTHQLENIKKHVS